MTVLGFIIAFLVTSAANAASIVAVYETSDAGCALCENPSISTGSCSCPAGSSLFGNYRVLNDCPGNGILHGGYMNVCSAYSGSADYSFGGAYQVDDPVSGGAGCRFGNPLAGGQCQCPGGFAAASYRVLVAPGIGSHVFLCVNGSSPAGAYQVTDAGACLNGNPTVGGGCGCPGGFTSSVLRTIVDGPVGANLFVCVPPTASTEICPNQFAVLNGLQDTTAAINACIAQTSAGHLLSLPAGRYGIASQLQINSRVNIGSASLAQSDSRTCVLSVSDTACVVFVAMAGCCSDGGLIHLLSGASGSQLTHIVIDGNRASRGGTPAWSACLGGNRGTATNARNSGASNVTMMFSASINALCASGFEFTGDYCQLVGNYFGGNGNHGDGRWSDGLTLLQCRYGHVVSNVFADNSDVDFILGCGTGIVVRGVSVIQSAQPSFAGFMMDNFDGSTCGDYTGATVDSVTVNCNAQLCDFGANFGPHAWYPSANIVGGSVTGLSVSGAKQGVNVGGAGTLAAPLALTNVGVSNWAASGSAQFNCGVMATSAFNIAGAGNVVALANTPTATSNPWNGCP